MSDKEVIVELCNGTTKTFPAGTPDEYIQNWSERAENRVASQHRNWADRDPMDFARVMAGRGSAIGNVADFLKETVPRYPENLPLIGGQPVAPDWAGRGALGRNPVIGTGDLATVRANIVAGHLDTRTGSPAPSLQDAPIDPNAVPETPTGMVPEAPITGPSPSFDTTERRHRRADRHEAPSGRCSLPGAFSRSGTSTSALESC